MDVVQQHTYNDQAATAALSMMTKLNGHPGK